ncbi:MAG TPA: aspartate aminotransferase family protein [Segeticoccus sp.]|uniref:aspartate aminotransferase family protein n=1 Tax=Segeticoccus sp. TaxID=2706531 RepID=UPI002D8045BD|nr:aspartate aminotransferase family protein [Segeticoccus sp.]HET8600606.1 aspartate aminotransferase family protein [Segeticoccus sp.]
MSFDLGELLTARSGEGYQLHASHLNREVPRVLHAIDFDTVYQRAEGAYCFAEDGTRYLDFLAGFGVHGVGRNHPVVRAALHHALDAGLADLVQMDAPLLPGLLAEQLLARTPGLDRVFFCNSGTEAVEAALQFARAATRRQRVLYCQHAYHGLTVGSLSVNGGSEFRDGFDPLLPDTAVPFGDLAAVERELRREDVAALVVEPVQGKGVQVAPPGYLAEASELLHRHGALLVCDEVQTGLGRTGRFLAYQDDAVVPDLVTVAKALSGGFVPVGAVLSKDWVFDRVYSSMDRVFVHATTFGGNALAMAAGLATLAVLDEEDLVGNAARMGKLLNDQLVGIRERCDLVVDVRGRGLMIGIEFGRPHSLRLRTRWAVLEAARRGLFAQMVVGTLYRRHRILTQVAGDHMEVIKLLPPLMISEVEVELFVTALADVLEEAERGGDLVWDFGRTLVRQALIR